MSPEGACRRVEVRSSGIRQPSWLGTIPEVCEAALRRIAAVEWDLSILFCGDSEIAALHGRYLGSHAPTDVMSFSQRARRRVRLKPDRRIAGDIVISVSALARNARTYRCSKGEEAKRLLIHGILHLAGMDHGRGHGGSMRALQERLVRAGGSAPKVGARGRGGTGT